MESIYEICFYGGLMLAILLLVVSVVLFITLKIPKVFGELTGRSAKKSIKEMKEGTPVKNSISKKEQAKYYNQGSGKIKVRDAVSPEKRKANRDDTTDALRPKTEKNLRKKTRVLYENTAEIPEKETDVLASESQETMNEEETNVLSAVTEEETAVLSEKEEETAVLAGDEGEETAVLAGDEDAKVVFDKFIHNLVMGIVNIQITLDVEKFCIGGGISAQDILIETLRTAIKDFFAANPGLPVIEPEIDRCQFNNDANLIGALKTFYDVHGR